MKKFFALLVAVMLLICTGAAVAEVLRCPNCGAEFNPELGYIYCPFCATPLSLDSAAIASDVKAGDVITFGSYEQDNNLDNGPEPIEWIVLDVQDGKALLLSKYGLDAKPYNTEWTEVTWETCTLRAWLNNDFMNQAFNVGEQSAILITTVDNSAAQGRSEWSTSGGNNTEDKVFLLSYAEANRYLGVTSENSGNKESRVKPTDYALKAGAITTGNYRPENGQETGWWWLRSPGTSQGYAADVYNDGSLYDDNVREVSGCIRPAFWLNLDSGMF